MSRLTEPLHMWEIVKRRLRLVADYIKRYDDPVRDRAVVRYWLVGALGTVLLKGVEAWDDDVTVELSILTLVALGLAVVNFSLFDRWGSWRRHATVGIPRLESVVATVVGGYLSFKLAFLPSYQLDTRIAVGYVLVVGGALLLTHRGIKDRRAEAEAQLRHREIITRLDRIVTQQRNDRHKTVDRLARTNRIAGRRHRSGDSDRAAEC